MNNKTKLCAGLAFLVITCGAAAIAADRRQDLSGDDYAWYDDPLAQSRQAITSGPYVKDMQDIAEQFFSHDYAKAVDLANKLLQLKDAPDGALLYRAKAYDFQNKNQEALADYNAYLAKHPNDMAMRSSRALVLARTGQYEKALDDFNQCLSAYPDDVTLLSERADVYIQLQRYDDAIKDLTVAHETHDWTSDQAFSIGLACQSTGKTKDALEYYTLAVMLNPLNYRAYANRALVYEDLNKYDFAKVDLTKATEICPNFDFAWASLAEVNFSMNNMDECIAAGEKAVELNPDNAFAHAQIGCALGNQGKDEDALKELQTAIRLSPTRNTYFQNEGVSLFRLKKYDEAVDAFTKSIMIKDTLDAREWRARSYICLNKPELALADYDAALVLKPGDGHFLGLEALVNELMGKHDLAQSKARESLKSLAFCPYLYSSLILDDSNSLLSREARLEYIRRAIDIPPGDSDPSLTSLRSQLLKAGH